MKLKAILCLLLLAWGHHSIAQQEQATVLFRCDFGGEENPLTISILFQTDTVSAIGVGEAGGSQLNVHIGPYAWSFMEPVSTGAVQTTTIMLPEDGLDGLRPFTTLEAVHSRHSVLPPVPDNPSEFILYQEFGTCQYSVI